jgi:dihydroorotate dehydrogenase
LQQSEQLESLLVALQSRNRELQKRHGRVTPVPLLVKISPDLGRRDLETIVEVIQRLQIDGIIATNTTISRENLRTDESTVAACGAGGLSGKPLTTRATQMIAELYKLTHGRIPLIGVGGIFTAEDAWEKICAGASLVQVYTGFIYKGPWIVRQINEGLVEILRREGFANIHEAVGSRAAEIQRNL